MSTPSRRPARIWRLLLLATVLAVVLLFLLERLGAIEVRSRLGHLNLPIFGTGLSRKQAARVASLRVGVVRGKEGEMRAVEGVLRELGVEPTVYGETLPDADVLVLTSCSGSDPDTVSAWLNAPILNAPIEEKSGEDGDSKRVRTPQPKRRAICLAHDTGFQHLTPLAATGRLDVLALGERAVLRRQVHVWGSVWEGVARGVESFVPIFTPPNLPPKVPRAGVHRAAIVDAGAEPAQLALLLEDLEAAILANPPLWSYTLITAGPNSTLRQLVPLGAPDAENPNPQRVPDYTDTSEGFTLHVFGAVAIPPLLNDEAWAVVRSENGTLDEVVSAVRGLDLVVPPFEDNITSTVPMALIAETPLLVTSRQLEAHAYLALYPPSYVLVPSSLGAIPALASLRRGADPWAENKDDSGFGAPRDGTVESYDEFRAMLQRENERAWGKVLLRAT